MDITEKEREKIDNFIEDFLPIFKDIPNSNKAKFQESVYKFYEDNTKNLTENIQSLRRIYVNDKNKDIDDIVLKEIIGKQARDLLIGEIEKLRIQLSFFQALYLSSK